MQLSTSQPALFLEDWLRSSTTSGSISNLPSSSSAFTTNAAAIVQSWSDLRDPSIHSDPTRLLSSLRSLASHPLSSLHVAEPHFKLLLSLLRSPHLPSASLPLISRLLYAYLRKSPRPSPHLLIPALPRLLSPPPPSPSSLLLLAALSAAPSLPDPSRSACLDLFCRHLQNQDLEINDDLLPETLAAIGYALSRAHDPHFSQILDCLFGLWDGGARLSPRLHHGLMILRLVEWIVSGFIQLRALSRIESLCGKISERRRPRFAVVMAAAGVLRAFRLNSFGDSLRSLVEGSIGSVADHVVSCCGGDGDETERRLLLQCISLGLVRSGPIAFRAPVFLCLCSALLDEVFPLRDLFQMAVENPNENSTASVIEKTKEHLGGVLFKEAGAVTGVFCNQYAMADDGNKLAVENRIWEYSQALYLDLRRAVLLLRGKKDELIGNLDKIAEAAFLMVVVFAAEVTKNKLNPKLSEQYRPEAAVKILVAFSCIEYLRRVRLPEYTEAVRRAVLTIQENAAACALFVESFPPYAELIDQKGIQF